jgi:hypothetical protein
MANGCTKETGLGDLEKTLQALRAWLEGSRRAWLQKNLKKILASEHEDNVAKRVQAEHRKRLERGHSRE